MLLWKKYFSDDTEEEEEEEEVAGSNDENEEIGLEYLMHPEIQEGSQTKVCYFSLLISEHSCKSNF